MIPLNYTLFFYAYVRKSETDLSFLASLRLATRKQISDTLTASIQFSLDHRPEAVQHALQYARDMGRDLADKFVGMYVNHWTLDYGEKGRETIRRFLGQAFERGLIPHRQELEFVV